VFSATLSDSTDRHTVGRTLAVGREYSTVPYRQLGKAGVAPASAVGRRQQIL